MKAVLTVLLLTMALTACWSPGKAAKDAATWPAVQMAWPAVKADIVRGGGDPSPLDAVIAAKDTEHLRVLLGTWGTFRDAALAGIVVRVDAGDLDPGVAESLRERLSNFEEALIQIAKPGGLLGGV